MRWKTLVAALMLMPPSGGFGAEPLPSFPQRTSYDEARRSLIAHGWVTVTLAGADQRAKGDERCDGRPEMLSCAGTGLAPCRFTFKRKDTLIEVGTAGEVPFVSGVRCRAGCR